MTVTAICPAESTGTPQSQDLALLRKALDEPGLIGFRAEIQDAIDKLITEQGS